MNEFQHTTTENVIEIEQLKKSFGDNQVLKGFNMALKRGENVVVFGRSGCGKSVLIKCIVGLIYSDSGTLKVFDKNVPEMTQKELDQTRSKIGFLFQSSALYDSMTVRENLEFPLRRHRNKPKDKNELNHLVVEALENVGLAKAIDLMPSELSGGMRKRIGVARSLILKPDIMLYDEPTTGLDPITGKEISRLIVEVQKKYNTSAIIITHDMSCAGIVANRMVALIEGIAHKEGTFDEMRKSDDQQIHPFFT